MAGATGQASTVPRSGVASTATTGVSGVSRGGQTARTPAMLVGRLLATGQGGDADGLRGGAQNGAPAPNPRSKESDDTPATRSQTAQRSDGRGDEFSGSTDRVKNPMFDQLVRSIRLNMAGRHSTARLRLNPPELGRMDVEVSVVDERARITVKTQTDAARSLIQERASELVTAIERQGITVERLDVGTELVTDRREGLATGFGESGDAGVMDDPAAHGASRQAGFTGRGSGGFGFDSNASEDASFRQAGLTGRLVEPDGALASSTVAESRLDIRV